MTTAADWGADDGWCEVAQVENEDSHVTHLYARQVAGQWEYTVVRWRWCSGHIQYVLRDGQAFYEDGSPFES